MKQIPAKPIRVSSARPIMPRAAADTTPVHRKPAQVLGHYKSSRPTSLTAEYNALYQQAMKGIIPKEYQQRLDALQSQYAQGARPAPENPALQEDTEEMAGVRAVLQNFCSAPDLNQGVGA